MDPRHRRALLAILEDVERIHVYVAAAGPAWRDDGMAVDAIAKRLEDAGEQAKLLPAEFLLQMPEVDWRSLKGLRDFLVHNYRSVVVEIISSTLDDDLPVLAATVRRFLASDDASKGRPA